MALVRTLALARRCLLETVLQRTVTPSDLPSHIDLWICSQFLVYQAVVAATEVAVFSCRAASQKQGRHSCGEAHVLPATSTSSYLLLPSAEGTEVSVTLYEMPIASLVLARNTVLPRGSGPWLSPCGAVDIHRILGCSTWSSLTSLHTMWPSSLRCVMQEQKVMRRGKRTLQHAEARAHPGLIIRGTIMG